MADISFTDRLTNLFNTSANTKVVTGFLNFSILNSTIPPFFENFSHTTILPTSFYEDYENSSDYLNNTSITLESILPILNSSDFPVNVTGSDVIHVTPIVTPRRDLLFQVFYALVLFLFSVIGIKGNLAVIIVICKEPILKIKNQLSNLPILNLAVADLTTISFVCLPAAIAVAKDGMPFNFMMCRVQCGIAWLTFIAVLCTMGIISVERYIVSLFWNTYVNLQFL